MFEVKLKIEAPGLETAINNLANAIATGAAPLMTHSGDGVIKEAVQSLVKDTVETAVPTVTVPQPVVTGDSEDESDDDNTPVTLNGQRDAHGILWDEKINVKSAEPKKADGTWKKRKKLDPKFYQDTYENNIREAVSAGLFTGPENLIPKDNYVPPVVEQPVVPAAPAAIVPAEQPVVPAAPPVVPSAPVVAEPPVVDNRVYDFQAAQGAVVQLFSTLKPEATGKVGPELLKLFDAATIQAIPQEKIKKFVEFTEKLKADPDNAVALVETAKVNKSMGVEF